MFEELKETQEWKKDNIPTCKYCGTKLPTGKREYCSQQCNDKDSVWRRE